MTTTERESFGGDGSGETAVVAGNATAPCEGAAKKKNGPEELTANVRHHPAAVNLPLDEARERYSHDPLQEVAQLYGGDLQSGTVPHFIDEAKQTVESVTINALAQGGCLPFRVKVWIEEDGFHHELLAEEAAIPALLAKYVGRSSLALKNGVRRKCSDTGNAERLFDSFGGDLLFEATRRRWRFWDGRVWALDETGIARHCARAVVRSIPSEAQGCENEEERRLILKHAMRSDDSHRIDALLKEAATLPGFATTSGTFDRDRMLFNSPNGQIDMRSGRLLPHNPADRITRISPVAYDPAAKCPRFERFLSEIMLGREELIIFLQRWFGYNLTGVMREQVSVFAYGTGANGKSTLYDLISAIMGDYAATTPAETFVVRNRPSIPNDLAALDGPRMLRASESEAGAPLAESIFKTANGGDPVSARFLHGEFFSYLPQFKLNLQTNHRPRVRGSDNAVWRRILLVPFEATFDEAHRDKDLGAKLLAEAPGILAWAVRGCLDWQERGLGIPSIVRAATDDYRQSEDTLGAFVADTCSLGVDGLARGSELYREYRGWAERSGERVMSGKAFALAMQERGLTREHTRAGSIWKGISICDGDRS